MWTQLKQLGWRWRGILVAAPSVTGLVILLRLTGILQILEWAAYDQYCRLRPLESRDDRIVIVGVDEADLRKYSWPLPDSVLAKLLTKIKQQQPRAIGLDIYRDLPVGKGYEQLIQIFKSTPNLIGIQKVGGKETTDAIAPPPVLKDLGQVSANDLVSDSDGRMRRGLLGLADQDNNSVTSLGLTLALLYLQAEGITPEVTATDHIKLGERILVPFEANDGGYIRTNAAGYQILLNYRGPRGSFETVSVQQVLEGQVGATLLRDRIVLIGSTAESLKDFSYTPYSVNLGQLLQPTPGVEIHAHLTSQVLSLVLDDRPFIKTWAEGWEWLWIALWSFVGAALVWQQRYAQRLQHTLQEKAVSQRAVPVRSLKILFGFVLAGATLLASTYLAFLQSWWIPAVPAFLALSGSAIAVTGYLAQTAAELRKTLGRYLTNEVVASLLETPQGLKLIGEKRKVTTLMSDIRGFTSLSERLPPEQVVRLLNLYLEVMTRVIKHYGGTINDLTGDGIVVFFGAPLQQTDDSQRAVACAIAMQLAMEEVNRRNQELQLPQLEMGIGINTGEVVVGNIGSEEHAKYTAIGNHVNLAARIESFTVGGQVLISQSTFDDVKQAVRVDGQTQAFVKGVEAPVILYEVSGISGTFNVFLPEDQDVFIALKEPIPVQYSLLEGKYLTEEQFEGTLVRLSAKGGEIVSTHRPDGFSNLKLKLVLHPDRMGRATSQTGPLEQSGAETELFRDLYAKVMNKPSEEANGFFIRFTSVPPTIAVALQNLRSDRRARR